MPIRKLSSHFLRSQITVRVFLQISAAFLTWTGSIKLLSNFLGTIGLPVPDPLFPFLTKSFVWSTAGVVEIAIAAFLLLTCDRNYFFLILCLFLLAWLSTLFLLYRLGLATLGIAECNCFGTAPFFPKFIFNHRNAISFCILLFMLIGSYTFLLCHFHSRH